jgi:hypothetical protein
MLHLGSRRIIRILHVVPKGEKELLSARQRLIPGAFSTLEHILEPRGRIRRVPSRTEVRAAFLRAALVAPLEPDGERRVRRLFDVGLTHANSDVNAGVFQALDVLHSPGEVAKKLAEVAASTKNERLLRGFADELGRQLEFFDDPRITKAMADMAKVSETHARFVMKELTTQPFKAVPVLADLVLTGPEFVQQKAADALVVIGRSATPPDVAKPVVRLLWMALDRAEVEVGESVAEALGLLEGRSAISGLRERREVDVRITTGMDPIELGSVARKFLDASDVAAATVVAAAMIREGWLKSELRDSLGGHRNASERFHWLVNFGTLVPRPDVEDPSEVSKVWSLNDAWALGKDLQQLCWDSGGRPLRGELEDLDRGLSMEVEAILLYANDVSPGVIEATLNELVTTIESVVGPRDTRRWVGNAVARALRHHGNVNGVELAVRLYKAVESDRGGVEDSSVDSLLLSSALALQATVEGRSIGRFD